MKRICYLLIGLLLFYFWESNVYAKTLTISEVKEEFDDFIENSLNEYGMSLTTTIDSENNKLDIYNGTEKYLSFKYTDDYIEYEDRDTLIAIETADSSFGTLLVIGGVLQSILNLSGYEDYELNIDDNVDMSTLYNDYGIAAETEEYEFHDENSHISGDYIRYFKISLNTDKIDALVAKYGYKEPEEPVISKITITASDILENSIVLFPKMEFTTEVDENYVRECYVYRSKSEDGTYEKISNVLVNCSGEVGLKDENLASGVTYYYKATSEDGAVSSEVIKVTTKDTTTNDKKPVNTGMFFPAIGAAFMALGAIILYTSSKKKVKFNRI